MGNIITKGYGPSSSSPSIPSSGADIRLLESGGYRLLENGGYRVLETYTGLIPGPPLTGTGTQPAPTNNTVLTTIYCTDEHVAVRSGGDYYVLCPSWQTLAFATDGEIPAGEWYLTSPSTTFDSDGVGLKKGNVVVLQKPASAFPGSGQLFAVDSVSGNTCTLRRIGQALGVGAPPCPSDTTGISFIIPTLGPQIEEVCFQINQTWRIDPLVMGRNPDAIYDPRVLRRLAVLMTLYERYSQETRKPDSEFALKFMVIKNELQELKGQLEIRWGTAGRSQPSTNIFSGRITR